MQGGIGIWTIIINKMFPLNGATTEDFLIDPAIAPSLLLDR